MKRVFPGPWSPIKQRASGGRVQPTSVVAPFFAAVLKAVPGTVLATAIATASAAPHSAERATAPASYAERETVQRFAQELAERHGWSADATLQELGQARYLPRVAQLIMPPPPGAAKSWAAYRGRFVEPQRLKAGVAFWNAHDKLLRKAERTYGVPASLIVGIIGVETFYGRHLGGFRVLDALATLSFDFPSGRSDRSAFFRGELEALLVWTRREGRAPHEVKGSYAGAIGWPQFMPSSILRHAVDFDGDGHINLERNMADVIGSVAHFLKAHGWTPGMPTHYSVEPPTDEAARAELLAPDIVPSFSAQEMAQRGAVLTERALEHPGPLALVALENGGAAPSYVAGTSNFYTVTRYNWSSYYALAVIELGQAVEAARAKARSSERASPPKAPRRSKARGA